MTTMASQITRFTVVYSTVYPDADQRKHQSSASLAFVCGIHRGPVNSPHKWPVTREMFPFDDVIMNYGDVELSSNLQYLFYHGTKTIRFACENKIARISNTLSNCSQTSPGGCLNIKMPSYQYRDSHVKDKTVSPTVLFLTWESPYLEKTVFMLSNRAQTLID